MGQREGIIAEQASRMIDNGERVVDDDDTWSNRSSYGSTYSLVGKIERCDAMGVAAAAAVVVVVVAVARSTTDKQSRLVVLRNRSGCQSADFLGFTVPARPARETERHPPTPFAGAANLGEVRSRRARLFGVIGISEAIACCTIIDKSGAVLLRRLCTFIRCIDLRPYSTLLLT